MHQFNNQLEVGQLAIIINTVQPENRCMIGKIVTVEHLTEPGDDLSKYFEEHSRKIVENKHRVIVYGVQFPKRTRSESGREMLPGLGLLKREYLMPLPPLEEKEVKREMELTQ